MFQEPEGDYENLQALTPDSEKGSHEGDETPPDPKSGVFQKKLKGGWQMYQDLESKRPFYVHETTNQIQWKPPRGDFHKENEKKVTTWYKCICAIKTSFSST